MTLDEAIKRAREVASGQRRRAGTCTQNDAECDKFSSCVKCAEEHEQLAKWLEELKALREIATLKKPDTLDINDEIVLICPNCGAEIDDVNVEFIHHCCACGQAIDLRGKQE